jgi:hypothetical protein
LNGRAIIDLNVGKHELGVLYSFPCEEAMNCDGLALGEILSGGRLWKGIFYIGSAFGGSLGMRPRRSMPTVSGPFLSQLLSNRLGLVLLVTRNAFLGHGGTVCKTTAANL